MKPALEGGVLCVAVRALQCRLPPALRLRPAPFCMAHPRAGPRAQRACADGDGVTARVRAAWAVRSPRRIRLSFREAALGELRPSARLEAALAPAALPRTWLTHRLLLGLQEVRRRPRREGLAPGRGLPAGGSRPARCLPCGAWVARVPYPWLG